MLTGTIALVIRCILMIAGGGLAAAGVITATAEVGYFCFDAKHVADTAAAAVSLMLGGGASVAVSAGWRLWAKRRKGVT